MATEKLRANETVEVMAERRRRHVHLCPDRPCCDAIDSSLHNVPKDSQTNGVPKSPEPFRMTRHLCYRGLKAFRGRRRH